MAKRSKNKHKNKKWQSEMRKKLRIQTSLGEAELTSDATIQIYIDNKNSILKKVRDLKKGDRVLFKKDNITTTLDDINPLLERNPFYRNAREQIFYRYNSQEDRVTMLRKHLLEGLAEKGYLDNSFEMQDKINQAGTDLTEEDKWLAKEGLEEILKSNTENE